MMFSSAIRVGETGGYPLHPETGTALAIYTSSKSARCDDGKYGIAGHGGARNRADRMSDSLTLAQANGVIDAAHRATAMGLPLNRHVTIHWSRAGVADSKAAAATGAFLTLVRDWLRKRGQRTAHVWVRENDEGDGSKGSHVHILLHLPMGAPWTYWRLRRWVERITGQSYRKGVVRTTRIVGVAKGDTGMMLRYQSNLSAVVSYIIKGTAPDMARFLSLELVAPGGRICGKRAAFSQNIADTPDN